MATTIGCSDGRPTRIPVSGQVLIDGKPLTFGVVRVVPANDRVATATIQPDGHFTLKTFEDGDGIVAGTHPVAVIASEQVVSDKKYKWHAPKKYARAKTSGLSVNIEKPTDSLVIELTWKGDPYGRPFTETSE
ncbi:MAG: hypothetical protein PVH19_14870 [Planctomycetia bacterium]